MGNLLGLVWLGVIAVSSLIWADVSINNIRTTQQNINGNQNITITGSVRVNSTTGNISSIRLTSHLTAGHNLRNSGILEANSTAGHAYAIYNVGTNRGIISNLNTIYANTTGNNKYAYGIRTGNNAAIINNSGTIRDTSSGNKSRIFGIRTSKNSGTITNSGTIENTSTAESGYIYGIYATSNTKNINNTTSIKSTSSGKKSRIYSIRSGKNSGTITNSGTIENTSTGETTYTYGIYTADTNGTVNNSGTIKSTSSGKKSRIYSIRSGKNSGTIINSGTIENTNTGNSSYTYGVFTLNSNGTINNSGIINGKSTKKKAHVYGIRTSNNSGSITNTGMIRSETSGVSSKAYGIYANTNTGDINNTGSITATSAQNRAYSIYIKKKSTGNILNSAAGIMTGDIYARRQSIINKGKIYLGSTKISKAKNLDMQAGSVLGIHMDNTAGTINSYSKFNLTGNAHFADGSSIYVDIGSPHPMLDGKILKRVVKTSSGIAVDNNITVTDNSFLLDLSAEWDANTIDLLVRARAGGIHDACVESGNTFACEAASVLDNYTYGTDPQVDALIDALNGMGSAGEISDAVSDTVPLNATYVATLVQLLHNSIVSIIRERQIGSRGFGAGGDISVHNGSVDKSLWIHPFAAHSEQDGKGGIPGFKANARGFAAGGEEEYGSGSLWGFAISYANSDANGDGISQSDTINAYSATVYGNTPVSFHDADLFYQAGVSVQRVDTNRFITAINRSAQAEYTSYSLFARAKLAKEYEIGDALKVMPGIYTQYMYYHSPSYTESGAGGLNLNVNSFEEHSLVLGIESDFRYEIDENFSLLASLGINYELVNPDNSVSAAYTAMSGSIFNTKGIENDRLGYRLGLGLLKESDSGFSADIRYDFEAKGNDFTNHVLSAKLKWKF